ncbi:MAG: pilin [Patescibacteria group bacterium]
MPQAGQAQTQCCFLMAANKCTIQKFGTGCELSNQGDKICGYAKTNEYICIQAKTARKEIIDGANFIVGDTADTRYGLHVTVYLYDYIQIPCTQEQICRDEIKKQTNCGQFNRDRELCASSLLIGKCFYNDASSECLNVADDGVCDRIKDEKYCGTETGVSKVGSSVCAWVKETKSCVTRTEAKNVTEHGGRYDSNSLLIPCAAAGNCRSINDFVELLVKRGQGTIAWLGLVGFLFFIYGGIVIILSFGSPEKVQKGKDILLYAVLGIVIALGAYILVGFILESLGVSQLFRVGV